MPTPVLLIHASPAALAPVNEHYRKHAPQLELTNLLDDGLLRVFSRQDESQTHAALLRLLRLGQTSYGVRAAMLTCSAVPLPLLDRLTIDAAMPVLKIDVPMARKAAALAAAATQKIGVVYTFAATLSPTTDLLHAAAPGAALLPVFVADAHELLLAGQTADFDALVRAAILGLAAQKPDVIVLAQVSLARVLPVETGIPILQALDSSLNALLAALETP